jgi:hypothetical protein
MLTDMTSKYHDSGILALGFSAAVAIDGAIRLWVAPGAEDYHTTLVRLVCGMLVGPLIVICLLLRATLPHRIVLAMGLLALIAYVRLGLP